MHLSNYWLAYPAVGIYKLMAAVSTILAASGLGAFFFKTAAPLYAGLAVLLLFCIYLHKHLTVYGYNKRLTSVTQQGVTYVIYENRKLGNTTSSLRNLKIEGKSVLLSSSFLLPHLHQDRSAYLDFAFQYIKNKYQNKTTPLAMLHLGGAGATLPLAISALLPNSKHTVVEINDLMITFARKYFLPLYPVKNRKQIALRHEDAASFIQKKHAKKYDVIIQDIFVEERLPSKFSEAKWFEQVTKATLKPSGILVINLGAPTNTELIQLIINTLMPMNKEIRCALKTHNKNVFLICSR